MTEILRQINIVSWPIWAKLLTALLLAALIPVALALFLTLDTLDAISAQNVEGFIRETGTRQANAISQAFVQAHDEINRYIADEGNVGLLRTVLPISDDPFDDVNPISIANLVSDMQAKLLNTPNSVYEEITVVDRQGRIVLKALPGRTVTIISGGDVLETSAFQRAEEAQMVGDTQVLTVDLDSEGRPLINISNVVTTVVPGRTERALLGYTIARLNVTPIIQANLPLNVEFADTYSQLINRRGMVIDADGINPLSTTLARISNDLLRRAENGDSNIEITRRDDERVIRYYAPIESSPFVLVVESSFNVIADQITTFLVERGFALVVGIVALLVVLVIFWNYLFTPPLRRLSHAIQAMSGGNYAVPLPDVRRGDEVGELAGDFADMRRRILNLVTDLEQRIELRARDVSATREISNAAATQRDLNQLMNQVVNLIVERFDNIYHAQIFLVDDDRRHAILRASTGEPGRQLLARGHRLEVGSISVIGRVTEAGTVVTARDTGSSDVHQRNEFLPDTLAELAIPLRVGTQIIGALDVQSRLSDTFDMEQTEVLQTMADQIAIAIENARLYTESLRQLAELDRNRQAATLRSWHEFVHNQRLQRLERTVGVTDLSNSALLDDMRQTVLARGEVVIGDRTAYDTIPLAVPIRLRGQLLGTVEWEVPGSDFDQDKVQLAQALTDQLAVNLENARLFQESQRATERERLVNEISSQLTRQNDIDQILQTAVREVGIALRSPQVSIRLNAHTNGNGHHNGHSANDHQGE